MSGTKALGEKVTEMFGDLSSKMLVAWGMFGDHRFFCSTVVPSCRD